MSQPGDHQAAEAPSENAAFDAVSPSAEFHPGSPGSPPPDTRSTGPLEAPLYLSPGSIRPPAAGAPPRMTPKPSSAPPPRLLKDIGLNSAPVAPISPPADAAQELAEALSSARQTKSGQPIGGVANPAASRWHHLRSPDDPLQFRRTIIPILLTMAIILIGAALLLVFSGEDNALPELVPRWTPMVLLALAVVCLGVAAANMASVRIARKTLRSDG